MPNWCNNSIEIKGSTETLSKLWEEATAEDSGLLNAMVPMPKELDGTVSPAPQPGQANYEGPQPVVDGFDNWYDWRVSNWGCKWDVDTEGLEYTDHGDGTAEITGWFDSPWGPPITAIETFCEAMDGVYVDLWYEEGGMDFAGNWNSEEGDDYLEGISDYARKVIKTGESGSDLYDRLDEYFEITEQRREWIEEELEEETAN
jgi:hypothetical protein